MREAGEDWGAGWTEDDENVDLTIESWTWSTSKKHFFYFTCYVIFDIYIKFGINKKETVFSRETVCLCSNSSSITN